MTMPQSKFEASRLAGAPLAGSPDAGPPNGPQQLQAEPSGVRALMRVEALAREAKDLGELRHLIANETRKFNRARQIFVVEVSAASHSMITAISSVASVDPQSYLVKEVEGLLRALSDELGLAEPTEFTLPAYCGADSGLGGTYPFPEIAWMPFIDRRGRVFGGMLLARDLPWTNDELSVTRRLSATFAHAWREVSTANAFSPRQFTATRWSLAAVAAVAVLLVMPVPMTALAPVEIIAARPSIVSAQADGVIETVVVDPSSTVAPGAVLVRLSDTTLRNRMDVAQQEVIVAEARARQATILAFSDVKGRHELGLAEAELALKRAELTFARDLLGKTVIVAPTTGIAVYTDRRSLVGKPVVTGERIMEIANPAEVEARVDLAVPDAIALLPDSYVRIFLDADPLRPLEGRVVRHDYRARPSEGDVLAYRTFVRLAASDRAAPRIGLRGTAQVHGATTTLGFYLFRRPLAAARQWIGL